MRNGTRQPVRPGMPGALAGDAVLTGAPAARRLYREIEAAPNAPLLLGVVGVAGAGKTVLLDALAGCYAEAGIRVSRDPEDAIAGGSPDPDTALLVDDAQLLPEPVLDGLRRAAESGARDGGGPRMVVANRTWPRSSGLAGL
ncbi:MAG: hypothetical protein J2P20_10845, partial [Pseudonocardia sp.]|nr:hypothetical protein [Pseudonocardia sp.]